MDSTPKLSTFMLECPIAVKWEIEEYKCVVLKDSEYGHLKTKWFDASNIPSVKYDLRIYPNGYNEETHGKVYIFLYLELGNKKKVKADYKFFIESANTINENNCVFKKSEGYGGACFTTNDLFDPEKKYIVNGKLILKCQGTLCVERQVDDNKWEKDNICTKLWKANDKDFTINVTADGKSIQAHKCVLAACSPVFEAMFNSGMLEATENEMEIIDFSYKTVELALELCYNRNIQSLTLEEKLSVLPFMNKYDILGIKDSLELSLAEDISLTSVIQIANCSLVANSINLQQRCMDFIIASFRLDQLIDDFDDLDETFALKVLKNAFYNIAKT